MDYIEREISQPFLRGAKYFPVSALTGPRQSGKSTLCRHLFPGFGEYNLEDVALRQKIADDPKGFIKYCEKNVIIDEAQHLPDLFSYIQVAVDNDPDRRFILTGSNNFRLMEKITQSLAGRAALFTLLPMALKELGQYAENRTETLLFNGFYPSVVTDRRPADLYYPNYYSTYVERDVRQVKNITDLSAFQTFIRLMAGRCGSEFNASQISVEAGISSTTVKSWMSILQASYIAFLLPPFFANLNKRLTKSSKVYFYDTGLLCFLLGIENPSQLTTHPLKGAVFENLAVIELLKRRYNSGKLPNLYFYRENSGREVDLISESGEGLSCLEVKASHTWNPSFATNLNYLKTLFGDKITKSAIVYDGDYIPPDIYNIRELTEKF